MACYEIKLTYADLSVTFRNWKGADRPRSRKVFVNESSYATSGNLIKSGTSFELPYLWTIAADLYQTEYDKLTAIWESVDYYRRIGSTTNSQLFVQIDDETEEIFEFGKTASTKTRTSVTGTTPREANGGVYYYPRFLADWVAPPDFGKEYTSAKYAPIKVRAVSMVLQDTRVKI